MEVERLTGEDTRLTRKLLVGDLLCEAAGLTGRQPSWLFSTEEENDEDALGALHRELQTISWASPEGLL